MPPFTTLFKKARLFLRFFAYALTVLSQNLHHALSTTLHRLFYRPLPPPLQPARKNVVVVGASFAGYHAALLLSTALPPTHRVVVVEPHSHFHFTWVFPRFGVVGDGDGDGDGGDRGGGGEGRRERGRADPAHKAFIPYGPHLRRAPPDAVAWKTDAVASIPRDDGGGGGVVVLRDSGEAVAYDYLVLATGSAAKAPSRVGVDGKADGVEVLRGVRGQVERAGTVVVVGAGAVGVEVATDAKTAWPGKRVVLVHSRGEVLGRFGKELRRAAVEAMGELGVEVVLGERVVEEEEGGGVVVLSSGRRLECDCLIDCTGQKPVSGILADLSPSSISESGHIRVKPTMQIADDSLPNVYAVGDVAETDVPKTNARSAMKQAKTAVDNILLAVKGQQPRHQYKYAWQDGAILLTLGLNKAVVNISDGETEMNFHTKGKDMSLYAASGWKHMGAKPFDDDYEVEKALD